jgi:hypothetical protein
MTFGKSHVWPYETSVSEKGRVLIDAVTSLSVRNPSAWTVAIT